MMKSPMKHFFVRPFICLLFVKSLSQSFYKIYFVSEIYCWIQMDLITIYSQNYQGLGDRKNGDIYATMSGKRYMTYIVFVSRIVFIC